MEISNEGKMHYVLRVASAMCFIGHGSFGILGKEIWSNYFAVFGIGHEMAWNIMPFVGAMDIICGLIILIYPLRIIVCWLVVWGLVTAFLRPLSGEPFPEFIERAGNYGAPLGLLILSGGNTFRNLFSRLRPGKISVDNSNSVLRSCLQIAAFLLLAGHGWLNLIEKKGLLGQYQALGLDDPAHVAFMIGSLEVAGAFSILIKPLRPVVVLLFSWKMFSELFYPHHEVFEFIERGGSYGVLLALWISLSPMAEFRKKTIGSTVQIID